MCSRTWIGGEVRQEVEVIQNQINAETEENIIVIDKCKNCHCRQVRDTTNNDIYMN